MRLAERYLRSVACGFGLLHGLGFASALLELGLPPDDAPLALLGFNLGVEAGQVAFILLVLACGSMLAHILRRFRDAVRAGLHLCHACAYVIGTLSAVWMTERLSVFVVWRWEGRSR